MLAIIDIVRVALITLLSLLLKPTKLAQRSYLSEFTFRLAKRLIDEAKVQDMGWLRARQRVLKLYDWDLRKVSCWPETINAVPCISIRPKALVDPAKVIIYLHGGGYTVGSAEGYTLTMAKIALATQAQVIGVEYRLAPEHAVPAAQEDCLAVTEALIAQDPRRELILMGDSAGGALCLATLTALANAGLHSHIAACVLISPWLAPLDSSVLVQENEATDILDQEITDHWKQNFYIDESQAIYLHQADFDPAILPPTYIQAAGAEVFIAQINDFSDRLKDADCQVEYEVFEGQFHVFQTFAPLVREAQDAINKIGAFIRRL